MAALRAEVPAEARSWVHWGATSQDILDTAAMLVATRAGAAIDADLGRLGDACAGLARSHRSTVMAGRTLLQQALPITFGLKAAGWLVGVDDARDQLRLARARLAVQLGGAAGTLASLGATGPAVLSAFAHRLGLAEPVLPWHTTRQRVAGLAGALGMVAGTAAKICSDVVLLAQTEVAEVAEANPGTSSTLPHKRNPAAAVSAMAAARRAHALVPVLLAGLVAEHERAVGAWQSEWESLSELLALTGGAAARAADVAAGLDVYPAAMALNLAATGGVLLAERVVLTVAATTGDQAGARQAVNRAVGQAVRQAPGAEGAFAAALAADPTVSAVLSRTEIDELLDPAGYLGATVTWIERGPGSPRPRAGSGPGPVLMDTQVGIIGAGPAGLVLAHLLEHAGIDCAVLEARDRDYVEARIRAGVLEPGTVALLDQLGLADRLHREGLVHRGVYLQFEGERHRVDFAGLTGKAITVYGQQEVIKDLIAARMARGGPLLFEAAATELSGVAGEPGGERAVIRFLRPGSARPDELHCDVVAGCDGFHGVSRASVPAGALHQFEHDFPFAWLGVLAAVAPSTDELDLRLSRAGLCPAQSALPNPHPPVPAGRSEHGHRRLARRPHLGGAAAPSGLTRVDAARGPDSRQGHHPDAELRRRAHVVGETLPGRRRRPYRPANRRQGS